MLHLVAVEHVHTASINAQTDVLHHS